MSKVLVNCVVFETEYETEQRFDVEFEETPGAGDQYEFEGRTYEIEQILETKIVSSVGSVEWLNALLVEVTYT